jgi:hypothetical protein
MSPRKEAIVKLVKFEANSGSTGSCLPGRTRRRIAQIVEQQPKAPQPLVNAGLGLAGAATGGVLGYLAFSWLAAQGFYALALPGVLLGLGAGVLARKRSMPLAMACGVLALALGVFAEWKHFPFAKDDSLNYFVRHLFDLRPLTLILIGLGGFGGFWFAKPTAAQQEVPPIENSSP